LDAAQQRKDQQQAASGHQVRCRIALGPRLPVAFCSLPSRTSKRYVLAVLTDGTRVRISDMNWMQVEEYLRHDDRAVLPIGSTEQHSYLRLTVDCILPERVAVEAAEPLGIPVFPVVAYGVTPYFR